MIVVFLSGWSTASHQVRFAMASLSILCVLLAVGIATCGRLLWALRLAAGAVGIAYVAYFVLQLWALLRGERQVLTPGQPSATMAGIALVVYAVPLLVFAISGFQGARWRTIRDFWHGRETAEERDRAA